MRFAMWFSLLPVIGLSVLLVACDDDDKPEPEPTPDAGAPYIYLYPEEAQEVSVTLLPAAGCSLTETIPEHGDGWVVWAEPSGRIDDTYDFLYYSASVHWEFQLEQGWAVPGEGVFAWFEQGLPELGLTDVETADFVDYWSDHLPYAPCYRVYPQDNPYVDAQVELLVEPEPDSVLRLWLVIIGEEECPAVEAPAPTSFEREGFVVVEWGVVLKQSSFVW